MTWLSYSFWREGDYIKHCTIEKCCITSLQYYCVMYIYLTVLEFLHKITKYSRIQVCNLILGNIKMINANNLYPWEGISSVA